MIKLRPHHLLCFQGYIGKGYSEEFVENMNRIMEELSRENSIIKLVFSTDDICSRCPNKLWENNCEDNKKIEEMDRKVIEYFKLDEKTYKYDEIINSIYKIIDDGIMEDICSSCSWYKYNYCKNKLLK